MRLAIVLIAAVSTSAMAEDYLPFQTPDGSVHCLIVTGGARNYVRCDVVGADLSFTEPPEDCDLDWGQAFEVAERGEGRPICVGDTVVNPDVQKMAPGYSHGIGGVVCFSEPEGMTCMNAEAHGFTLTLEAQTVF